MHKIINLNYNWFFSNKFLDKHLYDYADTTGFEIVDVPHNCVNIPFNNFDDSKICGSFCYKKVLDIKKEYFGKNIRLIFEGVAHLATIYINDNFVVEHKGGYDEFTVDITEYLTYGKDNILTVIVNSNEITSIPPFGGLFDYLGYSGIYREVSLEIGDEDRILDCQIRTPNVLDSVNAYCDVTVSKYPVNIELTVMYKEDIKISKGYNVFEKTNVLEFAINDRLLWDLDNPHLYKVNVEMVDGGVVLDSVSFNFGYREIDLKDDGLYLNGNKIKLRGLNRHQSYPYVGYAMPKSAQYKDADILKYELGLNSVLATNYMHSKHFLNRCDEIGLLVLEEIPGAYYVGSDEYKVNILKNVKNMIRRDINHPSIVMWGVRVNGSLDDDGLYQETNKIAHELDTTRPTFGTSNLLDSHVFEDVYGCKDYHNIESLKLLKAKENKKYIISGYAGNYFSKRFDNEYRRVKQSLKHLDILDKYNNSNCLGLFGWNMCDYNTHKQFGSGDNVNYSGVLDMFRLEKESSYVYKSQQDKMPILYVTSNLHSEDYDKNVLSKVYIYTNLDFVDIYRNDLLMGRYRPSSDEYKNVENPPIILNDLIGDLLTTSENFKTRDANRLKRIMKRYSLKRLSKFDKFMMTLIMFKYKLKYKDFLDLYDKYVYGEAGSDVVYRFEGYKNNELVTTVRKTSLKNIKVSAVADNNELKEEETYDVTRIIVKATDQDGNNLPYSFIPINIKAFGGIDIIGPHNINIECGYAAFWVKTNGSSNVGKVVIQVDGENINLDFSIENNRK